MHISSAYIISGLTATISHLYIALEHVLQQQALHVTLYTGTCTVLASNDIAEWLSKSVQVNTINLDTEVTFPNTAGSALATAAASSLTSTLSSDPGQVYTASGAALLTSATVAITNVTQSTSLVTSLATPAAQIGPGPAPVQYLLTAQLVGLLR